MKVFCRYSGVEFEVQGTFKHLHSTNFHPIFTLPLKELLTLSTDWFDGKTSKEENYLLFLALLRNTDLIDWKVPVHNMSYSTVQKYMEAMLKTATWVDAIGSKHVNRKHYIVDPITEVLIELPLPRWIINHTTNNLENVGVWLETWNNTKYEWMEHSKQRELRNSIVAREQLLLKQIQLHFDNTENYSNRLANWAMDAANVPMEWRAAWTRLFNLKGLSVYAEKPFNLDRLLEHMEDELPVTDSTTFSFYVLKHVRKLVAQNKKGIGSELGFDDIKIVDENSIENKNRKIVAASAPLVEPVEKDYSNKFLYLKAKAAFNVAKTHKQNTTASDKTAQLEEQQRQLDSLHQAEEAEFSGLEDAETLSLDYGKAEISDDNS